MKKECECIKCEKVKRENCKQMKCMTCSGDGYDCNLEAEEAKCNVPKGNVHCENEEEECEDDSCHI